MSLKNPMTYHNTLFKKRKDLFKITVAFRNFANLPKNIVPPLFDSSGIFLRVDW